MEEENNQGTVDKKLTERQQQFVIQYCVDFNGTQSAIRAGYSEKTAYSIASENLRKPEVKAAIKARLEELTMSAEEATKRLTDWGRGSIKPFLKLTEDGDMSISLTSSEAKDNYHLIRKIKQTKTITRIDDMEREEIRTEIELHDAKDAVIQMAKIHGQFVQKVDHTTNGKDLPAQNVQIYLPSNGRENPEPK